MPVRGACSSHCPVNGSTRYPKLEEKVPSGTGTSVGMNFRAQGNRECDYCKEFVPVDAVKCKFCTSEIEPLVVD